MTYVGQMDESGDIRYVGAEDAAKAAVLAARRPARSLSERRENARAALAAMEAYRKLDPGTDYWACADEIEAVLDHTNSLSFEEQEAEYEQYANSPETRPALHIEPEREALDEIFAGSTFVGSKTNNENAATAASTKGI